MNVFLDIETIPQQPEEESKADIAKLIMPPATMSKPETIEQWNNGEGKYAGVKDKAIDDAYRKTSFDATKGQICSIAAAVDDGQVLSWAKGMKEHDIIALFFQTTATYAKIQSHGDPYFIGHYIGKFDLKFLWQRAVILGIKPPFKLPFYGRHGKDYYCTMEAWAGYRETISQDNLCKALGIEGKPEGIDGSKVWDFYKAGKIEDIEAYNRDDVEKVRMIYNRLTFNTNEVRKNGTKQSTN